MREQAGGQSVALNLYLAQKGEDVLRCDANSSIYTLLEEEHSVARARGLSQLYKTNTKEADRLIAGELRGSFSVNVKQWACPARDRAHVALPIDVTLTILAVGSAQ